MKRYLRALLLLALLRVPLSHVHAQENEEIDLDMVMFTMEEATGERRLRLIRRLCKMDDKRAAEGLIQVLVNPKETDDADVQDMAFNALYRLRNPIVVPDLKRMLESGKTGKVVYAIGLLGRILGPKSFDLVKPFLEHEGEVLEAAIKAMGETRDPRAVELLRATLKRVGGRSDAAVFVRMSLIRLGDASQLKPLIVQYQRIIDEAFQLKIQIKYMDKILQKKRAWRRIKYLWSVQAELRAYFSDLTADVVPAFVDAVETTDANSPKQIVFELVPRMMDAERAPKFAAMLTSRYSALRQLVAKEYLALNDPKLRAQVLDSVRRYLIAPEWYDRRYAVMCASLLPDRERMAALQRATEDENVWVRAEAVRELGKWRTPDALALIEKVSAAAEHEELRFICRCALAGVREDLDGLR